MKQNLTSTDIRLIAFFRRTYIPLARFSIFVVFFWFGILKILETSPASPLAMELTRKTVGLQYYDQLFFFMGFFECVIGILFLLPKATRIVIPMLLVHLAIVCAPLLLVQEYTWQSFMVPTLEGQYIIKNLVVIAVAIGIAASTSPLRSGK